MDGQIRLYSNIDSLNKVLMQRKIKKVVSLKNSRKTEIAFSDEISLWTCDHIIYV